MTEAAAPLEHDDLDLSVRAEWIDFNGHMNLAHYVSAFDLATDNFFRLVTPEIWDGDVFLGGFYCVEMHVTYERELLEGQPLRLTTQVLGLDDKRLHLFHRMYHAGEGFLAATNDLLFLSVSRETRRAVPIEPGHRKAFAALLKRHESLGLPPQAGRAISVGARRAGP